MAKTMEQMIARWRVATKVENHWEGDMRVPDESAQRCASELEAQLARLRELAKHLEWHATRRFDTDFNRGYTAAMVEVNGMLRVILGRKE